MSTHCSESFFPEAWNPGAPELEGTQEGLGPESPFHITSKAGKEPKFVALTQGETVGSDSGCGSWRRARTKAPTFPASHGEEKKT